MKVVLLSSSNSRTKILFLHTCFNALSMVGPLRCLCMYNWLQRRNDPKRGNNRLSRRDCESRRSWYVYQGNTAHNLLCQQHYGLLVLQAKHAKKSSFSVLLFLCFLIYLEISPYVSCRAFPFISLLTLTVPDPLNSVSVYTVFVLRQVLVSSFRLVPSSSVSVCLPPFCHPAFFSSVSLCLPFGKFLVLVSCFSSDLHLASLFVCLFFAALFFCPQYSFWFICITLFFSFLFFLIIQLYLIEAGLPASHVFSAFGSSPHMTKSNKDATRATHSTASCFTQTVYSYC